MNTGLIQPVTDETLRFQAQMLDYVQQAVVTADLSGQVLYANRAASALYSWTQGPMAGNNIADIIVPAMEELGLDLADHQQRGIPWSGEFLARRRDGSVVPVSFSQSPLLDFHGSVIGNITVATDISDRKEVEDQIRRHQAILWSASRIAGLGCWEYDIQKDHLELFDEALRIFGITRDQFDGTFAGFLRFIHPDDAPRLKVIHKNVVEAGGTISTEYRAIRPSGEQRIIEVRGETAMDSHGNPVRASGVILDITERKRTESSLRERDERFRQLAENVHAVFWISELASGRVLYVSPAYNAIWGKDCQSLYEHPDSWLDSVHPDDLPKLKAALDQLGVREYNEVFRVVRPNGQIRWIRDRAYPVRNESGQIYRMVGTALDITDHKRNERQRTVLSSLGRNLNSANTPREAADLIVDAANELFGWDCATLDLYNSSTDEVTTVLVIDTVDGVKKSCEFEPHWKAPSPLARLVLDKGQQLILRKEADEPAGTHLIGDKSRPSRSLMVVPIRQGTSTVGILSVQSYRVNAYNQADLQLFQMFADYAAGAINRIKAEEHRREAEQRIAEQAALLDIAHDSILVKDLDDRIIYWNKGAERTYGWTAKEALGRKSVVMHKDRAKFCEATDGVLKHGEWTGEFVTLGKDNREITVHVRWTLVRDSEDRPKAILAINTDVTEKKKLEAQILRAQRMESIGTLAGGIAHDLNNVLAPIVMSVQMLRDIVKTQQGQDILDTLQANSQRGADLIRQVLSFARGMEGKRAHVNLRHLARDIEKVVLDTFPKNISFSLNSDSNLFTVDADPTQIHQVLMNLCVNSRDAMPNGGRLKVIVQNVHIDDAFARMNADCKPGPYVMLVVEDTGTGIAPSVQEKMFDPFFTTKEVGKGTGLGLATVLTIVKGHGGFINVYSEVGKGAKFKIYFPASNSQESIETPALAQPELPRGQGELIMIVDDEDAIRNITEKTLECFGYRTVAAANGAEAVAHYAQRHDEIALVLTDMTMPVMDGPATIVALRSINPMVRIIGCSGLGSVDGGGKAARVGVNEFISKPYTTEKLLKSMRKVLELE